MRDAVEVRDVKKREMSSMRVVMVRPPVGGHGTRGVGFYGERLHQALQKRGLEVCWRDFSPLPFVFNDFDIVHYPYFDLTYPTFNPLAGKRVVVTVHDLTPLRFPEHYPFGLRGKAVWPWQKRLLSLASTVVTDSRSSRRDILEITNLPAGKVAVVYLAADELFRPVRDRKTLLEAAQKYSLPERFALYVGGANWNKNLPVLVRACRRIKLPLVLAGRDFLVEGAADNVESQPLREVLNLVKGRADVLRPGFVPTEDLVALYNLATVYVQPSIYEGFGLPVLEAFACGCPVVCGENSSLAEIAGEAAIFAEVTDQGDLESKLLKLLKLPKAERERLMQKGWRQAEKFSWAKTAGEMIKIYRELRN